MMTHDSDGLDMALKLQENEVTENIPVIVQTGIRKPENLLDSYGSDRNWNNVKAVYEKPFTPEQLIKAVKDSLQK